MNVLASEIRRAFFLIVWTIVLWVIPYNVYGANSRFDISSILFETRYDSAIGSLSIQYLPHPSYLLPSLLICAPCFLWLYKQHKMRFLELACSAGLVFLAVILILLIFLPVWAVIPWIPGVFAAYVPEFIDLIPISGLAFTIMVLLPLIWRGIIHSDDGNSTRGKKVAAAVLSVAALIIPITTETFRWQGSGFNYSFFEGFSLNSATWSLSHRVDGNLWGQGVWFHFSTSSIFVSLSMILQILPGILFAWLVCKGTFEQRKLLQTFLAGTAHILTISIVCIWLTYTESHAGRWTITPFPALLVAGLVVALVNYGYQRKGTRQASRAIEENEEKSISQVVVWKIYKSSWHVGYSDRTICHTGKENRCNFFLDWRAWCGHAPSSSFVLVLYGKR